ncbi:unnamed protein product [Alternaria alternata]
MAAQAESQYELNNFDVSGLNQVGNSAHGDLNTNFRPHGNVEGTQQHNNFRPYLYIKDHKSITIFGVVALIVGLVLGLKLGLPKHESSSDPSASPSYPPLMSSTLALSDSDTSTPPSMPHSLLSTPTVEAPLSSIERYNSNLLRSKYMGLSRVRL